MASILKLTHKLADIVFYAFLKGVLWLRYSVRVKNLPQADGRPIMFLPNHPALIDPVIMLRVLGPRFSPRPLIDAAWARRPFIRQAVGHINGIVIEDALQAGRNSRQGITSSLKEVALALNNGDNVIFYPSGHIYHSARESVRGNSGLKAVLAQTRTMPRLVLARTTGLWGSSFSHAGGGYPQLGDIVKKAVIALFANLIFFIPRRRVLVEFAEPGELRRIAASGDKQAINRYLDDFYNHNAPAAFKVPMFFWQGSKPIAMPEPGRAGNISLAVPAVVRDTVLAYLRELSGKEDIGPKDLLGADLSLDSLSLVDLSLWLEREFGFSIPNLENLLTVEDCLEAAMGISGGQQVKKDKPVPNRWFARAPEKEQRLGLPVASVLPGGESPSLPSLFLALARRCPKRPLAADRAGGISTFIKTLTAIEALLPFFAKLENQRLGLMLPLTPMTISAWLACLLAGKTPVMVNWTIGIANMRHCLGISRVNRVVTAKAFAGRLHSQGVELEQLKRDGVEFIYLEDVAARLTPLARGLAWWRARFSRRLDKFACSAGMSAIAAILFTSGSEARPKAVPLSHGNLVANLRDAVEVLDVRAEDRLLGLLPPFHSLGLLANMVLPACMGIPMACHANPGEALLLNKLVKDYALSIAVIVPAFLDNMLARAQGTRNLKSLRLAFVGAEKCPDRVFAEFARQCPKGVLCEGYGVSECSPIISVNRPQNIRPGTIGLPLASLETALVAGPETNPLLSGYEPVDINQPGLLLVRGPSVFSGYLAPPPGFTAPASPFVQYAGKTWYSTGDMVSREQDGVLTFRGRLQRFIKMGGEMISLPQIEDVLNRAFAPGGDASGPWLAIETTGDDALITLFTLRDIGREEANRALRNSGLSGLYNIRRVIKLPELPLLGSGKVDYRKLKQEYSSVA